MQRYRVMESTYDFRANILGLEIKDGWEPQVKAPHQANRQKVLQGLRFEYGEADHDKKAVRFLEIGTLPLSIVAYHNVFLRQARDAYVLGSFYPALTASCALGERVLNQLILTLREDFKATPQYKHVHRKDSFDDWGRCIDVLSAWSVFRPEVAESFSKLALLRHKSIHFNVDTDTKTQGQALEAYRMMARGVELQFGGFGALPWFIENTSGVAFIKKSAEALPFIRRVYLPNCVRVGPKHMLKHQGDGRFAVESDPDCGAEEVDDARFAELYRAAHPS